MDLADTNSPPAPSSAPDIQQILAAAAANGGGGKQRPLSPGGSLALDESVVGQLLSATRAAAVGQSALLAGQRATQLLANANAAILLSKHRNAAAVAEVLRAAATSSAAASGEQAPPVMTGAPIPLGLAQVVPPPPPPPSGLPLPPQPPSHGTSAGFCTICKKFVSNRTNHKYVHSQVGEGVPLLLVAGVVWIDVLASLAMVFPISAPSFRESHFEDFCRLLQ